MTGATPVRWDDPGVPGGRAELYDRRRAGEFTPKPRVGEAVLFIGEMENVYYT